MKSTVAFILAQLLTSTASASLTYRGVDWSSTIAEESAGYTHKNTNGSVVPLEKILVDSGVNAVRQRLWVNPASGEYNLDYNLKLAKRAQAAGLEIYLDMHLSDTWADPSHQAIPSSWPSNVDDLAWEVYNYTLAVSNAFASASLNLSIISIGNEITSGFLWPTGATSSYYNIARLLHSASAGIRDSRLSHSNTPPQILVHLDRGWKWETQQYFYNTVLSEGPLKVSDFDIMGVSYYPFFGSQATLANLQQSLNSMAATWKKPLIIAETNWPTACPNGPTFPSDTSSITISAQGQKKWVQTVASVVESVPNGLGKGLFYWEPAWTRNSNLGSPCANNLMVDSKGKVLESLNVFGNI